MDHHWSDTETGVFMHGDYIVAAAGCSLPANHGCAVWISSTQVLAKVDGSPVRATLDAVNIVYDDPRRIFVLLRTAATSVLNISLHSPHGISDAVGVW